VVRDQRKVSKRPLSSKLIQMCNQRDSTLAENQMGGEKRENGLGEPSCLESPITKA
jgi:hypothetical protein